MTHRVLESLLGLKRGYKCYQFISLNVVKPLSKTTVNIFILFTKINLQYYLYSVHVKITTKNQGAAKITINYHKKKNYQFIHL